MEINQESPKFQDVSIAPMHTAEHILNQTMVRMFGCERSDNAHIERKKSKITYRLTECPAEKDIAAISAAVNQVIAADLPVTYEWITRDQLPEGINPNRLPEHANGMLRLVRIGDYDVCPCIGQHVEHTAQIGTFHILGINWEEGNFRIRFKLLDSPWKKSLNP